MNSIRLIALIFITITINYSFSQSDDFTVVIDAGHGGKDPGNTGNGYLEKKIALNISLKLGKQLENQGINVVYTRKKRCFCKSC